MATPVPARVPRTGEILHFLLHLTPPIDLHRGCCRRAHRRLKYEHANLPSTPGLLPGEWPVEGVVVSDAALGIMRIHLPHTPQRPRPFSWTRQMSTDDTSPLGGSRTPSDESLRRSNSDSGRGPGTGIRHARSKEDARAALIPCEPLWGSRSLT